MEELNRELNDLKNYVSNLQEMESKFLQTSTCIQNHSKEILQIKDFQQGLGKSIENIQINLQKGTQKLDQDFRQLIHEVEDHIGRHDAKAEYCLKTIMKIAKHAGFRVD